jgi:four helix bundle protein
MSNPVADALVAKTFAELAAAEKPSPRSRISNTSNGYIHLVAWSNASLLRILVHRFTDPLPKLHHRLKAQIDDAARSVIANIEEGFARPTTSEYLNFLGYSQASLIEVKGDIQRCRQDGLLSTVYSSSLVRLGIDLSAWHEILKKTVISSKTSQIPPESSKGNYRNVEDFNKPTEPLAVYTAVAYPPKQTYVFGYAPIDTLFSDKLTYEIFIELINKTNWHLVRLVESLEQKLANDQKFYQVEKARVRSNLTFRR